MQVKFKMRAERMRRINEDIFFKSASQGELIEPTGGGTYKFILYTMYSMEFLKWSFVIVSI